MLTGVDAAVYEVVMGRFDVETTSAPSPSQALAP